MAYQACVHVYVPSFPDQTLSSTPGLIIDLEKSAPGLPGYIDTRNPHGVNHLIVGELGHEELLLCACDDGDVVGYTVRSIIRHIEDVNAAKDNPLENFKPKPLRPFLLHNVGQSAWGLTIHKEARMAAVSANTYHITVFMWALDRPDPRPENEDFVNESSATCLESRDKNFITALSGHHNNIPAISFCNLPCDPVGKYLLSADIGGTVILWDIGKREMVQKTTLKNSFDQFLL